MPQSQALYTIGPSYDSTVAVELAKTGLLRKRKHILTFESFAGQLHYSPDDPASSRTELNIEAPSVMCRDKWLKLGKQRHIADYTRKKVLAADRFPAIRFVSDTVAPKQLRGFVIQGMLTLRGIERPVKVNAVLGPPMNGRFQIDADAPIRLSDFGIKPPSSLFGMIGTEDRAVVHLLLWATLSAP